ncbi:lactate utilization protein C [Campylobacter sp. CCS1377]|uniref:Lactate utilization protein C n=1 Tax=Campylobacter sp. CCS1377 TaxID=3158229 RepID=A0AAU7E7B2_9BACT|nr:lactate utilization protein C [Campylobacter jejuni]
MSRLNELSSKSKEAILNKVKNGHRDTNFTYIPSSDPVGHIKTSDDALEELKEKMSANKYIVEEATIETLEEKINQIVAKYGYEKMIYGSNLNLNIDKIKAKSKICFNEQIENLRSEVFHSEFSIIHAKAGVSSHGVALVLSSKEQPRMLSLAPTLCIMLLKKESVVKSLAEALTLVKKENETLPSNILFIAGPSRTADIELIPVFGVHGSQIVHIIFY